MKRIILFIAALTLSAGTMAEALEEIIVTAQKRSGEMEDMPAITIKKRADYLVQRVQLINDSRSPDLRKKEIIDTIDNLIKASKKIKGIELSYGDGFLVPVNLNDDSLQFIEDKKRSDTSSVNISIKIAIDEKRTPKEQIAELRQFIAKAERVSRTEIENIGDIGLSIVGPEQYRYDILKKIADENNRIKQIVGGNCETKTAGLQGRVEWERSDTTELTLFIRYATEVACK
jgi:hypothetical protein